MKKIFIIIFALISSAALAQSIHRPALDWGITVADIYATDSIQGASGTFTAALRAAGATFFSVPNDATFDSIATLENGIIKRTAAALFCLKADTATDGGAAAYYTTRIALATKVLKSDSTANKGYYPYYGATVALAAKAPLASPTFTGKATTPALHFNDSISTGVGGVIKIGGIQLSNNGGGLTTAASIYTTESIVAAGRIFLDSLGIYGSSKNEAAWIPYFLRDTTGHANAVWNADNIGTIDADSVTVKRVIISDTLQGLVLYSAAGVKYRLRVTDSGNLTLVVVP
jgi:hypothetical protein